MTNSVSSNRRYETPLKEIICDADNPLQQHQGTTTDSQSAIDKDTEVKLQSIEASFKKNQESVVKKILDRVVLVNPELHRNLKEAN